jgi:hypothetical protein
MEPGMLLLSNFTIFLVSPIKVTYVLYHVQVKISQDSPVVELNNLPPPIYFMESIRSRVTGTQGEYNTFISRVRNHGYSSRRRLHHQMFAYIPSTIILIEKLGKLSAITSCFIGADYIKCLTIA